MSWKPNPGHCPDLAVGKRVKVKLRDGSIEGAVPISSETRAGWRADELAPGKGPAIDWRLSPEGRPSRAFDVVEWDFV